MEEPRYVAFVGDRAVAAGTSEEMLRGVRRHLDRGGAEGVLVFEEKTGKQTDFSFHGSVEEMLAREIPEPPRAGPGRPKLGVVSREVTLLPRHWEWLEAQPNGISAAIRRLVEEARRREPDRARVRQAKEAAHRFMTAMAGNKPGFEEAMRALYAGDRAAFAQRIKRWPKDIRAFAERTASDAFLTAGGGG